MTVYFNDNEKFVLPWLSNLFPGNEVDGRSIVDVQPAHVSAFKRAHFFAGIGGWEYTLQLAGWPDEQQVWTGSCPCQPFSAAGKHKGEADERHLWPEFRRLIAECLPPVVFGEQVASKDGRIWLAGVRADLEALGYAVGAADLCAAGVGAPHIRQRLYWGAYRLGDTSVQGLSQWPSQTVYRKDSRRQSERPSDAGRRDAIGGLVDADQPGSQGRRLRRDGTSERFARATGLGAWGEFDLVECADGKTRRFEPGAFPLAHGVPSRVGRIRAYGGAIVPQVAADFVRSFMGAIPCA